MEPAHVFQPILDWPAPPPPARPAARLYLPGADCLASNGLDVRPGRSTTTTVFDPAAPPPTPPALTPVDPGTTIPPDVLDPLVPLPSVPVTGFVVYDCVRGLPAPPSTTSTVPSDSTTPPDAESTAPDNTTPPPVEPATTQAPGTTVPAPPASGA